MKQKRIKLFLIVAVLAAICAGAYYRLSYPIKLNMATLDWETSEYLKHGDGPARNVKFLGKGLIIDRKEYYLISVDEQFGYVSLEKGPLGCHRISNVSYGDGAFANGIIESKGKKYLLFSGLDSGGDIEKIAVEIQGLSYDLTPGEFRPFLTYCEVDASITDPHVSLDDIVFYDEAGKDITSSYDLSGGGIK